MWMGSVLRLGLSLERGCKGLVTCQPSMMDFRVVVVTSSMIQENVGHQECACNVQGRFLDDESDASTCGIVDGHTVLLVPKPSVEGRRGHRRSSSTGVKSREVMKHKVEISGKVTTWPSHSKQALMYRECICLLDFLSSATGLLR